MAGEVSSLTIIGYVESPYKEKFAVPRQPNLATEARGKICLTQDFSRPELFTGLEKFSHIWLIFAFHLAKQNNRSMVRPPRLGGNQKVGIFASRSPFRVNNLGLSCVEFKGFENKTNGLNLLVAGLDLVDGTPIYDIKPYLPYADVITTATSGFAESAPTAELSVEFEAGLNNQLKACEQVYPGFKTLLIQVLGQDPRPAFHSDPERIYGVALVNWNVRFSVNKHSLMVCDIQPLTGSNDTL